MNEILADFYFELCKETTDQAQSDYYWCLATEYQNRSIFFEEFF